MSKIGNDLLNFLITVTMLIVAIMMLDEYVRINHRGEDAYVYVSGNLSRASYRDVKMFDCSWCHRTNNLNRHHIIPQSADISLKDVTNNIVVLCRDCHFVLGHRCNWKRFNPDVMEIVGKYTNVVVSASYAEQSNAEQNKQEVYNDSL